MQGSLKDMSVPDLIQHTCLDRKQARLTLQSDGREAILFFDQGEIVHARQEDIEGEEVIYRIIDWQEGTFTLDVGQTSPKKTITRSWAGLLLDAARVMDESSRQNDFLSDNEKEVPLMATKKKSELLADSLANLLAESSDITGAAVVGIDGLVYSANVPQKDMDENLVGAASAAILGLSKRSVAQLKRGNLKQTLIQGDEGNIIVSSLNDETLFVALTPANVNLGMAFAEVRSISTELNNIL